MRISNSFYIITLVLCFFLSFVTKAEESSFLQKKLAPENAEKLKAIGGESGLKNFLAKYKDAPCGNCKEAGRKIFGGRTIDEMLENYVEVAHTFRNRPDLWKKIEDLAYVINSNKANINEVKQAFKELFKNKKDELFEIILKNNTLKNNLLGEGLTKSEAKNVFGDLINSTDSVLYNFIKF